MGTWGSASCARAARWDGALLAAVSADGMINPLTPSQPAEAVAVMGGHRPVGAGPFAVAVITPGPPDAAATAALAEAWATGILVAGACGGA
ncbi:MAG: hypothetical protein IPM45_13860 [Acidimicrobiales bacterium]|nr:hypothetical protein [Acidimicrobiales bacterium]